MPPLKQGRKHTDNFELRAAWVAKQLEKSIRDLDVMRATAGEFGVSERQARKYMARAYELIREQRDETKLFSFERIEALTETQIEQADSLRQLALGELELDGLLPVDRMRAIATADRTIRTGMYGANRLARMHKTLGPANGNGNGKGGTLPAAAGAGAGPLPLGLADRAAVEARIDEVLSRNWERVREMPLIKKLMAGIAAEARGTSKGRAKKKPPAKAGGEGAGEA